MKIFNRGLRPDEISEYVSKTRPKAKPALSVRTLPSGPPGPGRFGAYYTTLKYYDAWDAPWRVGEHADVIVWIKTESTKPMKITLTPSKG